MKTVLLTGATRGLGLAIAQELDRTDTFSLVLAVRDLAAGERVAATLRRPARVVRLDTGALGEVHRFARAWNEPLFGLVNNAGLQETGGVSFTTEGIESTLAVNHLGPLALTLGLLPSLVGGRVIGIGSGTHNPENRTATMWGFRGARYTSIEALARGEADAPDERQAGLDRYATSKLLSTVTLMALARQHPQTGFYTLDPGMLPGTGLARTAPGYARFAWSYLLPWLVPLLPDASTPARSASVARRLLEAEGLTSGQVYDFRGEPSRRVWAPARAPDLAARVLDESLAWLGTLDGRAPPARPLPSAPAA